MHRHRVQLMGRLAGVALSPAHAVQPEAAPPPIAPPPPAPPVAETPRQAEEVAVLRATLAELEKWTAKVRTEHAATINGVAKAAVELAVALAERLTLQEIAANRQRLDRIVRSVLERMQPSQTVAIRGHADDLALLESQIGGHAELEPYRTLLTFRPEPTYQRGQLRIECDDWFIDWDTRRALAELRDALLEETFADE